MRRSAKRLHELFKCVVYNRNLSVVVAVGASITMRAHSDSRQNVVFQGECWFFSALFCTLSEKIEHSALTSRKTGKGTNEMPRAMSARISIHRALNVGCDGWEQPHRSKPGASHAGAEGRPWHGCRTVRGHHTTMRKACTRKRLNQHGHTCAHARLHICTTLALPEARGSRNVSEEGLALDGTLHHCAIIER